MRIRTALKVRKRSITGNRYPKSTLERMRNRLHRAGIPDDIDIGFCNMLDSIQSADPIAFAAFQFECGLKLIEEFK